MIGWRQGEWVELPAGAEVAALHAGPSLFETFAVRGGRVACLSDHVARLVAACPRLGLDPSGLRFASDEAAVWSAPLGGLLGRNRLTDGIVRWLVAPVGEGRAMEWLTVRALPATPAAVDLYQLATRRDAAEWQPRPKSGPWLNSSEAWRELRGLADRPDAEGVQFDARGCLSEGPRSGFAWWDGDCWNFPAADTGRLPGTAQAQFRAVLAAAGRPTRDVSWPGFPLIARSCVVLRSTFDGGAAPSRSCHADGKLVWRPSGDQSEAVRALAGLAAWRAQRSVSLA